MSIKEQKKDFSDVDYRFSFSVTINDTEIPGDEVIVVKRYFNIYNFDEESLCSLDLKESVDDIVSLIDRDLKSKSRVYMWYNYDENYVSGEFSTPLPKEPKSVFKFTFFDREKPVITKIWSGDAYPLLVRNNVDLTNKKYKYDNSKNVEMDFVKQIAQKASADKPDLTTMIMRHISTTCSSYQPRSSEVKLMYKQYISDIKYEDMALLRNGKMDRVKSILKPIKMVSDDNGVEKELFEVYTTKYVCSTKTYDLKKF